MLPAITSMRIFGTIIILITISSVAVGQISDLYFFNYANTKPSVIKRENIIECRVYDSSSEKDFTYKTLKYIKTYNSKGFQTSELEYWNGDTTDIDEQYYNYDSADRVVESTYIMNQPFDATKTTYEYDEFGKLILTCDYSTINPDVDYELDSCITLEYGKNGILSKTSSTNGVISTFTLKKGTLLEYSADGLLETKFENGQPIEKIKEDGFTHYFWDSEMKLIQITSLNLKLDTTRVSIYEYRDGLLISNKQKNYDNGKTSEYLYEYVKSR